MGDVKSQSPSDPGWTPPTVVLCGSTSVIGSFNVFSAMFNPVSTNRLGGVRGQEPMMLFAGIVVGNAHPTFCPLLFKSMHVKASNIGR